MPDQDLTFEKSLRSPKVTNGHEMSTITFVAIVMLDNDLNIMKCRLRSFNLGES
jgi:hypothetical protein